MQDLNQSFGEIGFFWHRLTFFIGRSVGQCATIPVVKTDRVKDPTGAGDSYRGGLISGLIRGKDIEQCAKMGGVCASFAVECYGTQEYRFTATEFNQRLKG